VVPFGLTDPELNSPEILGAALREPDNDFSSFPLPAGAAGW
jgi:hypothetical protein